MRRSSGPWTLANSTLAVSAPSAPARGPAYFMESIFESWRRKSHSAGRTRFDPQTKVMTPEQALNRCHDNAVFDMLEP